MSGKLVVAPSRTALKAPIVALTVTSAKVASPASESDSGPTSHRRAAAHERHERGDEDDQREDDPHARPDESRARRARRAAIAASATSARDERRPRVQRRRDADDRDPREPEDLRPRIEAMDRARGVTGHARAVQACSAHAVAARRRVTTTMP